MMSQQILLKKFIPEISKDVTIAGINLTELYLDNVNHATTSGDDLLSALNRGISRIEVAGRGVFVDSYTMKNVVNLFYTGVGHSYGVEFTNGVHIRTYLIIESLELIRDESGELPFHIRMESPKAITFEPTEEKT